MKFIHDVLEWYRSLQIGDVEIAAGIVGVVGGVVGIIMKIKKFFKSDEKLPDHSSVSKNTQIIVGDNSVSVVGSGNVITKYDRQKTNA